MEIRTATMNDLDAVAAVEAECFPVAEAATKEEFAERIKYYGDHFWLMFEGDKLIGGDDVVKAFKEAHPDAFQTDPVPPKFSYDTHGGEATGVTGVEAAFLARNPGLKVD